MHIDEMNGWYGGTILDLAAKNNVVLAATLGGIHRSTDGGQNWSRVGDHLPDLLTQAVALTKDNESNLALAASNAGWLYMSHDQGETWETISSWRNIGSITRVAISPNVSSDGILLACSGENGIYKSTDYGRTWKAANFGLLNLSVLSLSFSPNFKHDEVILAGTDKGGLFRSRNAARAWQESGMGLPDATVQSIAFSPSFVDDGTVFAGTDAFGLFWSTDKARTWTLVSDTLGHESVNSILLDEDWASGGRILIATDAGIWASVDAGVSWQFTGDSTSDAYTLACAQTNLFAGTYQKGVYTSIGGITWHPSNSNLAAHLPPLATFSSDFENDQTLVLASTDGELARSQDAGRTWIALSPQMDTAGITSLTSTGAGKAMTLFAVIGTDVMCSQNSGDTWSPILNAGARVTSLSASSTFAQDGKLLIGTREGQVLLSDNTGLSWQQVYSYSGEAVIALMYSGQDMNYAVTAKPLDTAVWQLTLRECASGETLFVHKVPKPTAVLNYSHETGRLYCALGSHVWVLQDHTVMAEGDLPGNVPASCLASDGSQLYAGTRSGTFMSSNKGQSWTPITPEGVIVALHTAGPGQVYAVEMGGRLRKV